MKNMQPKTTDLIDVLDLQTLARLYNMRIDTPEGFKEDIADRILDLEKRYLFVGSLLDHELEKAEIRNDKNRMVHLKKKKISLLAENAFFGSIINRILEDYAETEKNEWVNRLLVRYATDLIEEKSRKSGNWLYYEQLSELSYLGRMPGLYKKSLEMMIDALGKEIPDDNILTCTARGLRDLGRYDESIDTLLKIGGYQSIYRAMDLALAYCPDRIEEIYDAAKEAYNPGNEDILVSLGEIVDKEDDARKVIFDNAAEIISSEEIDILRCPQTCSLFVMNLKKLFGKKTALDVLKRYEDEITQGNPDYLSESPAMRIRYLGAIADAYSIMAEYKRAEKTYTRAITDFIASSINDSADCNFTEKPCLEDLRHIIHDAKILNQYRR